MKATDLKKRLSKERPLVSVQLQMPEDVLGDLQKIAAFQGISSPEALMRQYIGQSLRRDLELYDNSLISVLIENLKRHGVDENLIQQAVNEAIHQPA
ncbi:MAG: hypothetical protein PHR16_17780 [Methylovulum sp.]|nr:hypothetical protein [Methylovulum sp.]